MKFLCERCGTRYSIADEKVRQKILKIRCKSCDNVITLRDSAVLEAGADAPKAVASSASSVPPALPKPPKPAVPVVERAEWHLAVDGQQKGPFTKAQLANAVIAQKAGAEVFVWKDGLDGWKEPSNVPEIERVLAQVKSGRPGPSRPPTSPGLPAKPLAALALSAGRGPAGSGRSLAASASDHVAAFDEGEATQIQPLSAALMADLASQDDSALDSDNDKTPVGNLNIFGNANGAHGKGKNGNGKNGNAYKSEAAPQRPPLDLFSDAPATPFFPPPVANEAQGPSSPAPCGPHSSMGGESGLSKVMGLGGRASRKLWLRYTAGAAAALLLSAAIYMAVVGGGTAGPPGAGVKNNVPGTEPGTQTPEQLEQAAADEAKKWFPDQPGGSKVAHVGGPELRAPVAGKRPAQAGKPSANPLAPPPLTPPPVGAFDDSKSATPERKVDFGLAERRAAPTKKAPSSAPAVDQASIGNVVRRKENQDAVKLCYNRVLRRTGAQTGGRIEVVVNIGVSGKVRSVALSSPTALNAVHDCLKQAVNRWRFPASPEDYETGFTLVLSGS